MSQLQFSSIEGLLGDDDASTRLASELQFINIHSLTKDDDAITRRKIIKSHVMKRVRNNRRHNSKDLIPHISPLLKPNKKTLAVPLSIKDKQVDPVLPLLPYGPSLTDAASSAHSISHYSRVSSISETFQVVTRYLRKVDFGLTENSLNRNPIRIGWYTSVCDSEAFFHSSLCIFSAQDEVLNRRPLSIVTLFHRGKAIEKINEYLNNTNLYDKNGIVGAIFGLASFECVMGNIASFQGHIEGLRVLMGLKITPDPYTDMGLVYIQQLLLYECYLRIYSATDANIAYAPIPIPGPKSPIPKIDELFSWGAMPSNDFSANNTVVVSMLVSFHELAVTWDSGFMRDSPDGDSHRFVTGCNTLIHQLSTIVRVGSHKKKGFIFESLYLAMLMYACRGASNGQAIKGLLKLNPQNLRSILERDDIAHAWSVLPGALIWCLFVGGTEEGSLDAPWFIAQLMQITTGYNIVKWEHVQHTAMVFTWLIQCSRAKAILER